MALDFHIGADEQVPAFSLSEGMHRQLFVRTGELSRLPQLGRIHFYEDASYEGNDLAALLQELRQAIPSWAGRPQMQAELRQLEQVCQTALAQGKGVYVWCD